MTGPVVADATGAAKVSPNSSACSATSPASCRPALRWHRWSASWPGSATGTSSSSGADVTTSFVSRGSQRWPVGTPVTTNTICRPPRHVVHIVPRRRAVPAAAGDPRRCGRPTCCVEAAAEAGAATRPRRPLACRDDRVLVAPRPRLRPRLPTSSSSAPARRVRPRRPCSLAPADPSWSSTRPCSRATSAAATASRRWRSASSRTWDCGRRWCRVGSRSTPRGCVPRRGAKSACPFRPTGSSPRPRRDASSTQHCSTLAIEAGADRAPGPRARRDPSRRRRPSRSTSTGSGPDGALRDRRRWDVVGDAQGRSAWASPATSASGTPSASTPAMSPGPRPSG